MINIHIDKEKCIKCGACIRDCITYSIERDENGFASIMDKNNSNCISCQHCFAICPVGAISVNNISPEEVLESEFPNSEDVLNLIRSRRSIRQFKDEEISNEIWEKIKEMLPYIPTGCNYNGLHFSIIKSKSCMDRIREYVNAKILKLISNRFTQNYAGKFVKFKKAFENNEDIIFRNSPHMIIVSSDIKAPCASVDPIIALSYIELYAQSLGLGTCWCGFAQACFKLMPELSNMTNIPNNYKPVYVMLIGKPAVKYPRITKPNKFPISELNETNNIKLNTIQKLRRVFLNLVR